MNCNKCGSQISADSKFCIKCGEKIVNKNNNRKNSILYILVTVVFFILAFSGARYLTQKLFSPSKNSVSIKTLVDEAVAGAKKEITIPSQINETTKLVDITAEPKAVRYHYTFTNVDPSQLSNDFLKNRLITGICNNSDVKNLFDNGINMEYSYTVEETQQNFLISITKNDCLN